MRKPTKIRPRAVTTFAAPPAAADHRGHGPRGYRRSDDRIHADVCRRLSDDDVVDACGIEVGVRRGLVTMTGAVPHRAMKIRAEEIAAVVGGVVEIDNRIRVMRGHDVHAAPAARRAAAPALPASARSRRSPAGRPRSPRPARARSRPSP
jgi:hypothetical protein